MPTVQNIQVDQNQDVEITIPDVNANAEYDYMALFYYNSVIPTAYGSGYIGFIKATVNFGGSASQFVVNPGVSYVIPVSAIDARLLNGNNCTYRIFQHQFTQWELEQGAGSIQLDQGEIIFEGTVTVVPLEAPEEVINPLPFINDITNFKNQKEAYTLSTNDYTIILDEDFNDGDEITLRDRRALLGKIYEIKNNSPYDINIKDYDGTVLVEMLAGDFVRIKSLGTKWEILSQ